MASQPRKNGRCLAKNSENTQFATFNLGCKNFAPCDFFFIPAILHATRLLRRPSHAKLAVAWAKNSENTQLPTFNLGCKKFAQRKFFSSQPFFTLHVFYGVPATKTGRCLAKNSQNTKFATFNLGCKKFSWREIFSSQPLPTLHVFYGVPTTQNWPLPGRKQ